MFSIFPVSITKQPLINEWQSLATKDPVQIERWKQEWRDRYAYHGVPTGLNNDLLVLDIDVKDGRSGIETLKSLGLSIPVTMWQQSQSGGYHYLFKYPKDGKKYGNKANIFSSHFPKDSQGKPYKTGLDTRGEGGYIAWYGNASNDQIAEAPAWMLEVYSAAPTVSQQHSTPYLVDLATATSEFNRAIQNLRLAGEGSRNHELNTQAYVVGKLVASGAIPQDYAIDQLRQAARQIGLDAEEIEKTIASGFGTGIERPLTVPFPAAGPQPQIDIPLPTEIASPPVRWTPRFATLEEVLDRTKLKKPQLFQDWSTEDIALMSADGGTGKSTLALYEAVCMALGERFLGFECLQSGTTLFITGEDSEAKLKSALGEIMRQMGLFNPEPGNPERVQKVLQHVLIKKDSEMCVVTKTRDGFLAPSWPELDKLKQAVDDLRPKKIIFDPIASFWGPESSVNDMTRAVVKWMNALQEYSGACIEMINHIGKTSSNSKDENQFAGRGGTALPSHSRVSKVMYGLNEDEYQQLTGEPLNDGASAIKLVVNKFTDGSPLYRKPFVIIRKGYLFTRKDLSEAKVQEERNAQADIERVFGFIKESRNAGKYVSMKIVIAYFASQVNSLSKAKVEHALNMLAYQGFNGEFIKPINNPDVEVGGKVYAIIDELGTEV